MNIKFILEKTSILGKKDPLPNAAKIPNANPPNAPSMDFLGLMRGSRACLPKRVPIR